MDPQTMSKAALRTALDAAQVELAETLATTEPAARVTYTAAVAELDAAEQEIRSDRKNHRTNDGTRKATAITAHHTAVTAYNTVVDRRRTLEHDVTSLAKTLEKKQAGALV